MSVVIRGFEIRTCQTRQCRQIGAIPRNTKLGTIPTVFELQGSNFTIIFTDMLSSKPHVTLWFYWCLFNFDFVSTVEIFQIYIYIKIWNFRVKIWNLCIKWLFGTSRHINRYNYEKNKKKWFWTKSKGGGILNERMN